MENTKIISCFSCTGKTYLGNKYNNVLDLESSHYKWLYNDPEIAKDIEKRKGILDREPNPLYPDNYIKAIKENINKYDIILITPEKKIRDILLEYKINYLLVYPTDYTFVSKRALLRGNNKYFAEGLKDSFRTWYPEKNEKVLWELEDEYLEDVLKNNGIINELNMC